MSYKVTTVETEDFETIAEAVLPNREEKTHR